MKTSAIVLLFLTNISQLQAKLTDCKNPYTLKLENHFEMKFCEIPAGTMTIGFSGNYRGMKSGASNEYRENDFDFKTNPKITTKKNFQSFQMGQYEVTNQQYLSLMDEDLLDRFSQNNPHAAMGNISFIKAKAFINLLNRLDPSATYRLPTEAEWEYAARAGTITQYYWGKEFNGLYVFYEGNVPDRETTVFECPNKILNQLKPGYCANQFGLMHMLGNKAEMTSDEFKEYFTSPENSDGHVIRRNGIASSKTIRGGSTSSNLNHVTVYDRFEISSEKLGYENIGIRIARFPKK